MSFDERLRQLFDRYIETPDVSDPEGVIRELSGRYEAEAAAGGAPAAGTPWWVAGLGLLAGVVLGIGVALVGSDSAGAAGSIGTLDGVPVFLCPGEGEVGTLYRGDEVLITGRSPDSRWLQIRNVRGSAEQVFIEAASVVTDADLDPLPEQDCEDIGFLAIGDTTTTTLVEETTTTLVGETTTTTAAGQATTTTAPRRTTTTAAGATTTTPPATTTTTPPATTTAPDTTSPVLSQAAANPGDIWEQDGLGVACPPGTPRQSTISVQASDNQGVSSVTASWSLGGSTTKTMTHSGGGLWTTTFGPFPAGTVADGTAPAITITMRATDTSGNISSPATVQVQVHSISECLP